MRQFASQGFRIWNLSREAKLVYTLFGLMSLAALASSALFYEDLVGTSNAGIRAYYAGAPQPQAAAPEARPSGGGPAIDLPPPDEARQAAALTAQVTYRKLLEVTHFHLFTVPVFLLIIAHLFMLTGLSSTAKMWWIGSGWLAALGHLVAPWVVHYCGAGWAPLFAWSGAALAVTTVVLTGYPMWAMWMGRPAPASAPPPAVDPA